MSSSCVTSMTSTCIYPTSIHHFHLDVSKVPQSQHNQDHSHGLLHKLILFSFSFTFLFPINLRLPLILPSKYFYPIALVIALFTTIVQVIIPSSLEESN